MGRKQLGGIAYHDAEFGVYYYTDGNKTYGRTPKGLWYKTDTSTATLARYMQYGWITECDIANLPDRLKLDALITKEQTIGT